MVVKLINLVKEQPTLFGKILYTITILLSVASLVWWSGLILWMVGNYPILGTTIGVVYIALIIYWYRKI